jgi:hypothetical protein
LISRFMHVFLWQQIGGMPQGGLYCKREAATGGWETCQNVSPPRSRLVQVETGTYHEHMSALSLKDKLAILSDAARYDASCASSGTVRRDSRDGKGLGSTEGSGICHAYAPDGRCISLLKILMTNFCIYDCAYCINRVSSNVARARFSVDEVVN